MLTLTDIALLEELTGDPSDDSLAARSAKTHSMNSKTYFSSKAMSNRRSNVKYSFLNDLRLWCSS